MLWCLNVPNDKELKEVTLRLLTCLARSPSAATRQCLDQHSDVIKMAIDAMGVCTCNPCSDCECDNVDASLVQGYFDSMASTNHITVTPTSSSSSTSTSTSDTTSNTSNTSNAQSEPVLMIAPLDVTLIGGAQPP